MLCCAHLASVLKGCRMMQGRPSPRVHGVQLCTVHQQKFTGGQWTTLHSLYQWGAPFILFVAPVRIRFPGSTLPITKGRLRNRAAWYSSKLGSVAVATSSSASRVLLLLLVGRPTPRRMSSLSNHLAQIQSRLSSGSDSGVARRSCSSAKTFSSCARPSKMLLTRRVAQSQHDLEQKGLPGVEGETAHFADVDTKGAVNARTLNAQHYSKIDWCPTRWGCSTVGAQFVAFHSLQVTHETVGIFSIYAGPFLETKFQKVTNWIFWLEMNNGGMHITSPIELALLYSLFAGSVTESLLLT